MSKNNTYSGTTRTLPTENRSLEGIVYLPSKPVLDSELNAGADISSAKLQDLIRSRVPSGWLDADFTVGFDNTGNNYGVNTTNTPYTLYLNSKKQNPTLAVVNGWLVQVGGSFVADDKQIKLTFGSSPAGSYREDLVFLEVWKSMYDSGAPTTGEKPESGKIWKYGNRDYSGLNLEETDNIVNPTIGFETSKRVQLQYRIRIVEGASFLTNPEGINDENSVKAQGGALATTTYTFTNAGLTLDDYGLYTAGDGSTTAQSTLKTVDGYVYAIPMLRIHRRNRGAFSVTNQNGASKSITSGISDRPDNLYYDQIHEYDIEDLRHMVSFAGFDYQLLMQETFEDLLSGQLTTNLTEATNANEVARTNIGLYVNKLSASSQSGTENIGISPNGHQRYYSDVTSTLKVIDSLINSNTPTNYVRSGTGNWGAETITVSLKTPYPTGTLISSVSPLIYFNYNGTITPVNFTTWTGGLGASASFTLTSNPTLTNETLYLTYSIAYPKIAYKLTKPVTDILRVEERSDYNKTWGVYNVNDYDSTSLTSPYRRVRKDVPYGGSGTSTNIGYTYNLVEKNINTAASSVTDPYCGTIVSIFVNGTSDTVYYIGEGLMDPSNPGRIGVINDNDLGYILGVYNEANIQLEATCVKLIDGRIEVTFTRTYEDQTLRFDIVLLGKELVFDSKNQALADMGECRYYEYTHSGLSTSTVNFVCNNIVLGPQRQRDFLDTLFKEKCYIKTVSDYGYRTVDCTYTIIENTGLVSVTISSGTIDNGTKLGIVLLTNYALKSNEDINIFYNFYEYKGISNKVNFTNTSLIQSKVMFQNNNLYITTSGSGSGNGGTGASNFPKKYEPLIPKLPFVGTVSTGNFYSEIYSVKPIIGGSYSISSIYNSPYASGKDNYMLGLTSLGRGANKGGKFTSSVDSAYSGKHRLVFAPLLELVKSDSSNNFLPGELGLKVESNYISDISGDSNIITHYDGTSPSGEVNNSFDMFKIKGKPLIKIK